MNSKIFFAFALWNFAALGLDEVRAQVVDGNLGLNAWSTLDGQRSGPNPVMEDDLLLRYPSAEARTRSWMLPTTPIQGGITGGPVVTLVPECTAELRLEPQTLNFKPVTHATLDQAHLDGNNIDIRWLVSASHQVDYSDPLIIVPNDESLYGKWIAFDFAVTVEGSMRATVGDRSEPGARASYSVADIFDQEQAGTLTSDGRSEGHTDLTTPRTVVFKGLAFLGPRSYLQQNGVEYGGAVQVAVRAEADLDGKGGEAGDVLQAELDLTVRLGAVSNIRLDDGSENGIAMTNGEFKSSSFSGFDYIGSGRPDGEPEADPRVVPHEGGVRSVSPTSNSVVLVRAFVDADQNGEPSPEESIDVEDVRLGSDGDGQQLVFFTPPPYGTRWPTIPDGDNSPAVMLWGVGPDGNGAKLETELVYTKDAVRGTRAVIDGMKTACEEALLDPDREYREKLERWAAQAGARAETVLKGVLASAKAAGEDGAEEERAELVEILEGMPWVLREYINGFGPAVSGFKAMALPITFGQSQTGPPASFEHVVLMSTATGTLLVTDDTTSELAHGGRPNGGSLVLPIDINPNTHSQSVGVAAAHGWEFTWGVDRLNGVVIRDLQVSREAGTQPVCRMLSTPVIEGGAGRFFDLRFDQMSHLYINEDMHSNITLEGDGHGPDEAWVLSAIYRIPLNGETERGNQPLNAIVARQSYTLTSQFTDFEPTHCLHSAHVYPQVALSISMPNAEGSAPTVVKTTHRLAPNPQEGTIEGVEDEYLAGLFEDADYPRYWTTSNVPEAEFTCQPLPFWWNLFENLGNTVPQVQRETIFDTDKSDLTYISPDNIHLHHIRETDLPAWISSWSFDRRTEAPGSFDGTIHFHWRWGEALGEEYGGGELLLPEGQNWVMGLAGSEFPEDFTDFTESMNEEEVGVGERVLIVRCEQSGLEPGRLYHTFTTGFSVGLGAEGCALVDFGLDFLGGYEVISAGFGDSPAAAEIRAVQLGAIDAAVRLQGEFSSISELLPGAVFASLLDCEVAEAAPQLRDGPEDLPTTLIRFGRTRQGHRTPLVIGPATFSAQPQSDGFIVAESLFPDSLGFWLYQESEMEGAELSVSFESPVRQAHNVTLGVSSDEPPITITVQMYLVDRLVGTVTVSPTPSLGASLGKAVVDLDPGEEFDRFTITSSDPGVLLSKGALQTTTIAIAKGDFNYDSVVDAQDARWLGKAFSGSGKRSPFFFDDADLDGDGDVDAQDYTLVTEEVVGFVAPCIIAIESAPPISLDAVEEGQSATYQVAARDLLGGGLSMQWSASLGEFDDPSAASTRWTAPNQIGEKRIEVGIQLTIRGTGECVRTLEFVQPVVEGQRRPGKIDQSPSLVIDSESLVLSWPDLGQDNTTLQKSVDLETWTDGVVLPGGTTDYQLVPHDVPEFIRAVFTFP